MSKKLKKVCIIGVSPCYPDVFKKQILDMFADKKNRIDTVFAKKEDLGLLSWVREQISAINKSIILENNGSITRLNNAAILYDCKIKFINDYIKSNLGKKNILIIANGDPNFFGIGGTILSGLKENEKRFIEVYPAVSYMQTGFSKLKIPMTYAKIISLHGRDFEDLYPALYSEKKIIGIYTDELNTPYKIYAELEEKGLIEKFEFYVLTELCTKNEKIYKSFTKDILEEISAKKNIVILKGRDEKNIKNVKDEKKEKNFNNVASLKDDRDWKNAGSKTGAVAGGIIFGIDDDKYIHAAGEPTKKEIRSVSLGLMEIRTDSIIIDAACGSGSISIEASSLAYRGKVYSIDKNRQKIENLKKNIKKFGRNNIEPVIGELPGAIKNTLKNEQADSIFIGGGGAINITGILKESLDALKTGGVIVIDVITVETLYAVISFIKDEGLKYEMISVNVSRLKSIGEASYFQALNQIYVIKIIKTPHLSQKSANKKRTMTFKIEHNNGGNNSGLPSVKIRNKAVETAQTKQSGGQ